MRRIYSWYADKALALRKLAASFVVLRRLTLILITMVLSCTACALSQPSTVAFNRTSISTASTPHPAQTIGAYTLLLLQASNVGNDVIVTATLYGYTGAKMLDFQGQLLDAAGNSFPLSAGSTNDRLTGTNLLSLVFDASKAKQHPVSGKLHLTLSVAETNTASQPGVNSSSYSWKVTPVSTSSTSQASSMLVNGFSINLSQVLPYPVRDGMVGQSVVTAGVRLSLERVVVTPEQTVVYLHTSTEPALTTMLSAQEFLAPSMELVSPMHTELSNLSSTTEPDGRTEANIYAGLYDEQGTWEVVVTGVSSESYILTSSGLQRKGKGAQAAPPTRFSFTVPAAPTP